MAAAGARAGIRTREWMVELRMRTASRVCVTGAPSPQCDVSL